MDGHEVALEEVVTLSQVTVVLAQVHRLPSNSLLHLLCHSLDHHPHLLREQFLDSQAHLLQSHRPPTLLPNMPLLKHVLLPCPQDGQVTVEEPEVSQDQEQKLSQKEWPRWALPTAPGPGEEMSSSVSPILALKIAPTKKVLKAKLSGCAPTFSSCKWLQTTVCIITK